MTDQIPAIIPPAPVTTSADTLLESPIWERL